MGERSRSAPRIVGPQRASIMPHPSTAQLRPSGSLIFLSTPRETAMQGAPVGSIMRDVKDGWYEFRFTPPIQRHTPTSETCLASIVSPSVEGFPSLNPIESKRPGCAAAYWCNMMPWGL